MYFYQNERFSVLYDLNKNVGETWITFYDSCDITFTVDSISTEIINTSSLKVMYVSSDVYRGKITESIGFDIAPHPFYFAYCVGLASDHSYYEGLRCYEDSIIGSHNFGLRTCEYTNVGLNKLENESKIRLFPNPALKNLNVEREVYFAQNYSIFTITGTLMKSGVLRSTIESIDVSNFESGLYFMQLEGARKGLKFVIR